MRPDQDAALDLESRVNVHRDGVGAGAYRVIAAQTQDTLIDSDVARGGVIAGEHQGAVGLFAGDASDGAEVGADGGGAAAGRGDGRRVACKADGTAAAVLQRAVDIQGRHGAAAQQVDELDGVRPGGAGDDDVVLPDVGHV